jgi:hypothetical protein
MHSDLKQMQLIESELLKHNDILSCQNMTLNSTGVHRT